MSQPQYFSTAYRDRRHFLQISALLAIAGFASRVSPAYAVQGLKIIAFGDSLTAGFGLPAKAAFPFVLEEKLLELGFKATLVNAGVSGDTTADGRARLDWSLSEGADGVILELGANDMLRGIDPKVTKANLEAILEALKVRRIKVLITGMRASPSLGQDYVRSFEAIYPALASKYDAMLYPFFLEGVAGDPSLKLADGLHPNVAGVEKIVDGILPTVEKFLQTL